jgi:hypothetical protein
VSEYLAFALDAQASAGRKTEVWRVRATRDYRGHALLGTIRWFGRWRQYTFFPEPGTTFNADCLEAITRQLRVLNDRHRRPAA